MSLGCSQGFKLGRETFSAPEQGAQLLLPLLSWGANIRSGEPERNS